jgi:hypothetical protein
MNIHMSSRRKTCEKLNKKINLNSECFDRRCPQVKIRVAWNNVRKLPERQYSLLNK